MIPKLYKTINLSYTFNPIDKIIKLYERLVKAKKDRNETARKSFKEYR